ncbi:hypothetical protein [Microvirga aerophila]|uniref:hypothetical protein n=1 Tax=Microvirga aerophila TaxID=670291 RepID=UPI0011BF2284|nr:hypothetical protein [Microvirga aerophila]
MSLDLLVQGRSPLDKFLNELEEMSVADHLSGLNLLHLAVEVGPAHAFGHVDGISNVAVRSELPPAPEHLADGPVIGGYRWQLERLTSASVSARVFDSDSNKQ